ncbi:hypothetical protein [Nocardia brasiliensis]|uniref:hypothetical protein n=1 Tax=Nocardia brasiliensis TaxID=37326 RepID=UPI00366D7B8D
MAQARERIRDQRRQPGGPGQRGSGQRGPGQRDQPLRGGRGGVTGPGAAAAAHTTAAPALKAHVSRIRTALDVTNRVQAALLTRDAGSAG